MFSFFVCFLLSKKYNVWNVWKNSLKETFCFATGFAQTSVLCTFVPHFFTWIYLVYLKIAFLQRLKCNVVKNTLKRKNYMYELKNFSTFFLKSQSPTWLFLIFSFQQKNVVKLYTVFWWFEDLFFFIVDNHRCVASWGRWWLQAFHEKNKFISAFPWRSWWRPGGS